MTSDVVAMELWRRGFPSDFNQLLAVRKRAEMLASSFNLAEEAAVILALQERQPVLLLAGVIQARIFPEIEKELRSWQSVRECAKVWGQLDLIARLHISLFELQSIQRFLMVHAQSRALQRVYYLQDWESLPHNVRKEDAMKAWIIVRAPKASLALINRLKSGMFPEVKELGAVFGDEDIILRVEVKDNAELSQLVFRRLQEFEEVEATRTYVCVDGTYWQTAESS